MKMFIPTLGYELQLAKDWRFRLFFEDRNSKLLERHNWEQDGWWAWANTDTNERLDFHYQNKDAIPEEDRYIICTLPKDTILRVDRIYIRKGAREFDSVSFFADVPGHKKRVRFWAKLDDVNEIEFSEINNGK